MQVIKDHIAFHYEVLELMGQGSYGRVRVWSQSAETTKPSSW